MPPRHNSSPMAPPEHPWGVRGAGLEPPPPHPPHPSPNPEGTVRSGARRGGGLLQHYFAQCAAPASQAPSDAAAPFGGLLPPSATPMPVPGREPRASWDPMRSDVHGSSPAGPMGGGALAAPSLIVGSFSGSAPSITRDGFLSSTLPPEPRHAPTLARAHSSTDDDVTALFPGSLLPAAPTHPPGTACDLPSLWQAGPSDPRDSAGPRASSPRLLHLQRLQRRRALLLRAHVLCVAQMDAMALEVHLLQAQAASIEQAERVAEACAAAAAAAEAAGEEPAPKRQAHAPPAELPRAFPAAGPAACQHEQPELGGQQRAQVHQDQELWRQAYGGRSPDHDDAAQAALAHPSQECGLLLPPTEGVEGAPPTLWHGSPAEGAAPALLPWHGCGAAGAAAGAGAALGVAGAYDWPPQQWLPRSAHPQLPDQWSAEQSWQFDGAVAYAMGGGGRAAAAGWLPGGFP